MKKLLLICILLGGFLTGVKAQNAADLKWSAICAGKMNAEWYGSNEAKTIADNVISGQKTNGGWMKNIEWHKLTASEYPDREIQGVVYEGPEHDLQG